RPLLSALFPYTTLFRSLGRLADRDLITEVERTELSDAYAFLRMVEHRLQMEQGLQTHTVPTDRRPRELLARRMNFVGEHALAELDRKSTRLNSSHLGIS